MDSNDSLRCEKIILVRLRYLRLRSITPAQHQRCDMTFIKWIGIAEADRNLYLAARGDNLLTLTESFSRHVASSRQNGRRRLESGSEQVEGELR